MTEDEQQQTLQTLHDAAALLCAARGLVDMLEDLVDSGIQASRRAGISQAVIAETSDLTPGRVSQVIGAKPIREDWADRVGQVRDWPQYALEAQKSHFAGKMSYPPYRRRRPGGA